MVWPRAAVDGSMIAYADIHPPSPDIDALIAQYGRWRLLVALIHRPKRRANADHMSDYLRRDIGLNPAPHVATRDLML